MKSTSQKRMETRHCPYQEKLGMKKILFLVSTMLFSFLTWAQHEVSGQVVDNENKTPLQGVSVTVKNSKIGTTTDENGFFRLTVPSTAHTLVVSSTGFAAHEINLSTNQTNYSVALSRSVQSMDEVVVVVAYGEQERKKVTGGVVKVSA